MGLNDDAWEKLFKSHGILEGINKYGHYEIAANDIKLEREPRLMTKFDHQSNLPEIFKQNNLTILPVSRSKYLIGTFNAYHSVTYANIAPTTMVLPSHITSIDPSNLYSESAALHCAYVSGMIDDVIGEESLPTLSGRMSSKDFDFTIHNSRGSCHRIRVKNSQLEIDGGYESLSTLMLIEAKNETVNDFLIRQLYYPYRLWNNIVDFNPYHRKQVKPVFFTYSNDVFSFFVYRFSDLTNYNSLVLEYQKDYVLAHESIELSDILAAYQESEVCKEPKIPFPQANSFKRIVDLLGLLVDRDLTREDVTLNYSFDERQTHYYTTAGMYLGLIKKDNVTTYGNNRRITFRLSQKGKAIMRQPYKRKYLALTKCIFQHEVFRRVFTEYLQNGYPPSRDSVTSIMKECNLYNVHSDDTYQRRASTVLGWINWIMELQTS